MSDVQRWAVSQMNDHGWQLSGHDDGEYVTFADHVAAVAAAEQRIRTHEGCADAEREEGYDAGYTDALAAAREVVAALMPGHYSLLDPSTGYNVSIVTDAVRKDEALAAIDALRGESNG